TSSPFPTRRQVCGLVRRYRRCRCWCSAGWPGRAVGRAGLLTEFVSGDGNGTHGFCLSLPVATRRLRRFWMARSGASTGFPSGDRAPPTAARDLQTKEARGQSALGKVQGGDEEDEEPRAQQEFRFHAGRAD